VASCSTCAVASAANRLQTARVLLGFRVGPALLFGLAEQLLGVGLGEVIVQV